MTLTFAEISESLVLSHLNSLDPRKSTGPDGLSARFLKEIGCSIGYLILLTLIAEYFTNKECSHILQFIKVHGALDNHGNFRPISVVSVLAVCLFSCICSIICLKLIVAFVSIYICFVPMC